MKFNSMNIIYHLCKVVKPFIRNRKGSVQNAHINIRSVCEQVWPSGKVRLVSRGTSVRIRFGSPFSSKVVVCVHCLVTLSLTIHKTLNSLSSLPISMQETFWW